MISLIIGIVIALIALVFIFYYNRFVSIDNGIDNALAQIDVQLKKRADLVPNLLNSVKGYMKHEKSVISEVTEARKAFLSAKNIQSKAKAGADLQHALKSVFALAEAYPQLRANENFLQLQQELSAIEDRVAYSRQYYNDSILSYNNSVETVPGVWFANLYNKKEKQALKISAEERTTPKVSF